VAVASAAARWLTRECCDGSPGVQALLSEFAERAGATAKAAYAAAEAGRRAARHGDPAAPALLQKALRLASAEEAVEAIDRPTVLAQLAALARDPDETVAHVRVGLTTLEPGRDVLRARLLRLMANARTHQRRLDEAVEILESIEALLGDGGDPMERALALADRGWIRGYRQGALEEGVLLSANALDVAAAIDAPAFRARLCGKLGASQLRAGDWDGQLTTNLRDLGLSRLAQDVAGIARAHVNLGVCYTNRGLLALARAHTEAARDFAESYGELRMLHVAESNLAMIAFDDGRLGDAARHAEASRVACERRRVAMHPETWGTLARLARARGDEAACVEALNAMDSVAERGEQPFAARTFAQLARDDAEGRARLEAALASGISDPYDRATTQLALAVRCGDEEGAHHAEAILELLGADVALERRRWCP